MKAYTTKPETSKNKLAVGGTSFSIAKKGKSVKKGCMKCGGKVKK